jgi:hypothetical protein
MDDGPRALSMDVTGGLIALVVADLGGPLGEQATLVQFSTAFCAPRACRARPMSSPRWEA